MPSEEVWRKTHENIKWSMTDPGANAEGQQEMVTACRNGSMSWFGMFQDGFYKTQVGGQEHAWFLDCAGVNPLDLYDYGRSVIGLKPI